MIKICFVCTGNTCRSIMAERLAKKQLKKIANSNIKISSKGLYATGENITENAKLALKTLKASGANRKSIKLRKIDKNTLYVTMTKSQQEKINGKVISLSSFVGHDIVDPYGQDFETYLLVAKDIEKGVKALLDKISIMEKSL